MAICRWCGSEFIPRNSMQLNCSRTCKIRMDNFNAVNLTRKYKGLEKLTIEQYKNREHRNEGRNYNKKEKAIVNPDEFNYCSCCGIQIRNYVRFAVCKTCYEQNPRWYDKTAVDYKTERGLVLV